MHAAGGHRSRPFDYPHLIYKERNFIHLWALSLAVM